MEAKGTCTNAPPAAFLPWPEGNSPCAGSDLSRVTEAKAFQNISPTKAQGQMSCGMCCGFFSPRNALCAAPQNSLNVCVSVDVNLYQKLLCGKHDQAKQDHFCCCQEITVSITVSMCSLVCPVPLILKPWNLGEIRSQTLNMNPSHPQISGTVCSPGHWLQG